MTAETPAPPGVILKNLLLQANDGQLDASMFPLIEKWDDEPTPLQLLEVIDKCIYASLASGFVVGLLQACYELACADRGTTHDEVVKLATWREDHN